MRHEWDNETHLAVIGVHANEVEDVHDPIAVDIARGVRFHNLAVVPGDCGCIEDIHDVIAVRIAGAEGQESQKYVQHDREGTTAVKSGALLDHTIAYNLQSQRGGGPGTNFGPTSPATSRP